MTYKYVSFTWSTAYELESDLCPPGTFGNVWRDATKVGSAAGI